MESFGVEKEKELVLSMDQPLNFGVKHNSVLRDDEGVKLQLSTKTDMDNSLLIITSDNVLHDEFSS